VARTIDNLFKAGANVSVRPRGQAQFGTKAEVKNVNSFRYLEKAIEYEIDRQIELYRSRDAEARRGIVGLQPKRAEVILAGACIVRTVMDKLGQQSLTVSDRGLRHGLLVHRFGA
jgi:exopolyphosphatase/pppGpp-phosphohydrolase